MYTRFHLPCSLDLGYDKNHVAHPRVKKVVDDLFSAGTTLAESECIKRITTLSE